MAMSKRLFAILLLGVLVICAGAVALVVLSTKKGLFDSTGNDLAEDEEETEAPQDERITNIDYGRKGSRAECQGWLRRQEETWEYAGTYGRSAIATRETISATSGNRIIRNAYWLTGDPVKDVEAMDGIQLYACMGEIPVIVIKMRPTEKLRTTGEAASWDFYKPVSTVQTWNAYDTLLNKIINRLIGIPSIIILEPDLLMFTFDLKNQQSRWINEEYEEEFLKRAQRVIKQLNEAWVYVDAGHAAYLGENLANVDQMAKSLLRLPGLRGFSINAMHFVNQSYNELIARRLHCRTGLHYVVDTSRNGGPFSRQSIQNIQNCYFDPPNVEKGQSPGFSWGSRKPVESPRLKRWISQIGSSAPTSGNALPQPTLIIPPRPIQTPRTQEGSSSNQRNDPNWEVNNRNNQINNEKNNKNNNNNVNDGYNYNPSYNYETTTPPTDGNNNYDNEEQSVRSEQVAIEYLRTFKTNLRRCMKKKSTTAAHDANVWIKTPGEADGRLYSYGTYHSCLMGHSVKCDDECQMFVQKPSFDCKCDKRDQRQQQNEQPVSPTKLTFPFEEFPLK